MDEPMKNEIQLFEDQEIRVAWDAEREEWYFSIVDVVSVLTDSPDYNTGRKYWNKLKQRLKDEGSELVTNCHQLKMRAADGKNRLTDVADTEQLLRIIQSIPSPKAEPFKLWLAQVGRERIEETIDPELTIDRALETYLKKGYTREWINQRMQAIQVRKELTDEWDARGVQKGVERVVKLMMLGLLFILMALVIRSLTLPGAEAGVSFYLSPDPSKLEKTGLFPVINAAMNQAFFTLSVGIGAMCIFGSYQGKDRSLTGEAMWIMGLDTFVALMAGLIIFPACFAFGVEPGSGPGLVFVTLPNIFNVMAGGQLWGTLFFIFMSFAALSTVIAVFENIISYSADVWGMERRRATWLHAVGIWVCSLPCALGFNLLADFQPLGPGTCVLDLEDFLLSNNLLPFGCLLFLLFCSWRRGWGWDNFVAEVNQGQGVRFPRFMKYYLRYGLPCIILLVFVMGYVDKFGK